MTVLVVLPYHLEMLLFQPHCVLHVKHSHNFGLLIWQPNQAVLLRAHQKSILSSIEPSSMPWEKPSSKPTQKPFNNTSQKLYSNTKQTTVCKVKWISGKWG